MKHIPSILVLLIILALRSTASAAVLIPTAIGAGQSCIRPCVGQHWLYNRFTLSYAPEGETRQATLYGGLEHGRRYADACRPTVATYAGQDAIYYNIMSATGTATRLWVAGDEIRFK